MKNSNQNPGIITWTARIISIAFAFFISIFSMDIFSEGYGFWKTIMGLTMHLIPTFILVLIIIISWRKELVGAVTYTILGILYIYFGWGKIDISAYLVIAGPLFILGALYFIGWSKRKLSV